MDTNTISFHTISSYSHTHQTQHQENKLNNSFSTNDDESTKYFEPQLFNSISYSDENKKMNIS